MTSFMAPRRSNGAQQGKRPSLSGNGGMANARSSSSSMRSKFAVSYEALLNGEHPWLNAGAAPSGSGSVSGTPLPTGASSPSASSALSLSGTGYFSSTGKKPSAPRTRFFADLLCLKVEPATLMQLLAKVPAAALTQEAAHGSNAQVRDNIGSLWRECLRVWVDKPLRQPDFGSATSPQGITSPHSTSPTSPRDVFSSQQINGTNGVSLGKNRQETDEVRRANAAETLVLLSRAVLAKKAASPSISSLDLIWIYAGGIDEADEIFESLVHAIDDGLRGHLDKARPIRSRAGSRGTGSYFPSTPSRQTPMTSDTLATVELPTLAELLTHRRHALHLAIIWVSHITAANLSVSAYFVRRDLFVAACNLLAYAQALQRSAQVRSANVPLANEDANLLRSTVRDVTLLIGLLAGLGQGGLASSANVGSASYQGSLETSFSPYYRRLCDWVDHPAMLHVQEMVATEMSDLWRTYELGSQEGNVTSSRLGGPFNFVTEGFRKRSVAEQASLSDSLLPPPHAAILLPTFLLMRANQVFIELAMRSPPMESAGTAVSQPLGLPAALFSASSYLVTHGSLNPRARLYSRLSLLTFLTLLSSNAGITSLLTTKRDSELAEITECKQRSGPLPMRAGYEGTTSSGLLGYLPSWASSSLPAVSAASNTRQRLLPYVLDCCVQYMRHNLRKKLDSAGYLICIQVIHLSIQNCAQRRVQLEYGDWPEVWRALNSLAAFLVARNAELQGVETEKVGQALITTFSTALAESDRYLEARKDINVLIYELIRTSETLQRLASIVTVGASTSGKARQANGDSNHAPSKSAIVSTIPSWRMLDTVFNAFDDKLRAWNEKGGEGGMFGVSFSIGAWTGGYLGGDKAAGSSAPSPVPSALVPDKAESNSRPSSSSGAQPIMTPKNLPGVRTVSSIIESLDIEQIIQRGSVEHRQGASRLMEESWIEGAEAQCLGEAFRVAAEDVRYLLARE